MIWNWKFKNCRSGWPKPKKRCAPFSRARLTAAGQDAGGEKIFTLEGADYPYRLLIQEMSEGAVTVERDGTILYCNQRFAQDC